MLRPSSGACLSLAVRGVGFGRFGESNHRREAGPDESENMTERIGVFISYTHDSESHMRRVLSLTQQLRAGGVDAVIDQFILGHPPEGWPLWMERQIERAQFVLMVCSPIYHRRFRGEEVTDKGLGSIWEAVLTRQEIYQAQGNNMKFIPVLFEDAGNADIPLILRNQYSHYRLWDDYEKLLRFLTAQPEVTPDPVEPLWFFPRKPKPAAPPPADEAPLPEDHFARSISHYMALLNRKVERLTQEQLQAIRMLRHLRRVRISGCAGSGKTLVAAEKSIRLAGAGVETLFVCHNPLLARHVTQLTQGSGANVTPFSPWVAGLAGDPQSLNLSRWTNYEEPDVKTLERAFDVLMEGGTHFDAVVVDEGQDFRDEWWEVVEAALKDANAGILYIFHDDRQALLPHRSIYPIKEPVIDLSRNCRNAGAVYELMRYFHPQAPMTDPELKDEGKVEIFPYLPGSEREAIERAVRWIIASGYGEEFVFLLGGSQSAEDFPLASHEIAVPMLKSWQEEIRRQFNFQDAWPHPDMQGLKPPPEGMTWVGQQLAGLSAEPRPNRDDIELVSNVARRFVIDTSLRFKRGSTDFTFTRWVVKHERLQLQRPDMAEPLAAEIIMHLEGGRWAEVITEPVSVRFRPYDAPKEKEEDVEYDYDRELLWGYPYRQRREKKRIVVKTYNVADFKGLEADVVLLLVRGGLPMVEQQLYVGISRARFVLAVLVDKGMLPLLPDEWLR